jgi:Zn finger protein HypA/HybF involved in hydrogenase expression
MKIIDVIWTPGVNKLLIKCEKCGRHFKHRSDRWNVICPKCKSRANLDVLRKEYTNATGTA